MAGRNGSESVAGLHRNGWPLWIGISGRNASEYAVSKFVFTKKGLPYIKRTHEKIWHSANLKAHKVYGVPIVSMYPGTKHSFGMQTLNQGFSKDLLQTIFGHTDKKTTERYAKYLTETLSEVMSGKIIPYGANVVQKDGRSQLCKSFQNVRI
jgi:integrase